MKREILCALCAENTSKAITGLKYIDGQWMDPYPSEHTKFLHGVLSRSCYCDNCGKELDTGSKVVALSIWADYAGVPYYSWESDEMAGVDK